MGEFGQKLKQEREKRGISLEEVALSTKIGTRMLRAIEEEHFDQLPGGIFNKGFVRAYAKHLGLNEEQTLADYLSALNATLPQPEAQPEEDVEEVEELQASGSRPSVFSWGRLAAALLVVAVVLGFWNLRSRRATPNAAPIAAKAAATPAAIPPTPKQEPAAIQAPPPAPTNPASTVASKPVIAPRQAPSVASQAAGLFHVLVRAREDSWIRVVADGKEIMQDTLLADGQRYIAADKEIVIKSGNVGGLEFWFNGQKLPTQGDPDQVKTLTFDPRGLVAPTARVDAPAPSVLNQP